MAIFSAQDLSLSFGDVALLNMTNFSIEQNDRVGLIGRNGTGKSSLLKIISGIIIPDNGDVKKKNGIKVAYVQQESVFGSSKTIFQAIAYGIPSYQHLLDYQHLLETDHDSPKIMEIQTILDNEKIWDLPHKINNIAQIIGLNPENSVQGLSGGEKKRISIASSLVQNPDILLLDEPTNHLDINGIAWLEETLTSFKGAIVLISHDRYFLDKVCTKIIELDRSKLTTFEGNFAYYQEKKQELLHNESVENAKFDKLMSQEEVWIRKGVEARRTKSVARINRLKEMRSDFSQRRNIQGNIKLEVSQGEKSGKIVAELNEVNKSFGNRHLVKDLSINIMRGDRVGIIGNNGIGKSTLVKILLGVLAPDSGRIKLGTNLQIAYFDQMREQLDASKTLAHTISPGSEWIEINGRRKHVISYLNDFLFSPQRAESPVSSLSGGERNRLLLARIFARPSNILVLDEPTNDLDIQTLELLEEKIDDYEGTVLLISHDRYFLDNIVNYIVAPTENGNWRAYVGGYEDWIRQTNYIPQLKKEVIKDKNKVLKQLNDKEKTQNRSNKLSYNEQRELELLPKEIEKLELEQAQISAELKILYETDVDKANLMAIRYAKIEEDLMLKLNRWQNLEEQSILVTK